MSLNVKYDGSEFDSIKFALRRATYNPEMMYYAYQRNYKDPDMIKTFFEYLLGFHLYLFKHPDNLGFFGILIFYPLLLISDIFEQWIPYYKKEMTKE